MTDTSIDPVIAIVVSVAALWLTLQLLAFRFLKRMWRAAAWLSGGAMILALAVGILGGMAGANMAPIWIFIALPLCTIWIILLWLARGIAVLFAR